MTDVFHKIAAKTAQTVGTAYSFIIAILVIIIWAITGPIFNFSDTWQLIINTGTTIVTFLIVFLIQNTQNRDSKAIHLKLDELIKASTGARTSLVNLEELSDEELNHLQEEFRQLQEKYHVAFKKPGKLRLLIQKDTSAERTSEVKLATENWERHTYGRYQV